MCVCVCVCVCDTVLRPSHTAECQSLLTARQTLLYVVADGRGGRRDAVASAVSGEVSAATERRRCGSEGRPWTIATARRGQTINVTVVDLASSPPPSPDAADSISGSGSDDRRRPCARYARFSEPEVVSSSRDRCDGSRKPGGESVLYSSQTGRVEMVLDRTTTETDKFMLIFTGIFLV